MTRQIRRVPKRKNNFGGLVLDFSKERITMEALMGSKNLLCGTMIRILWAYAREKDLIKKTR